MKSGYICMSETSDRISFNKGYTDVYKRQVIVPAEAAGAEGSSVYLKAGEKVTLKAVSYTHLVLCRCIALACNFYRRSVGSYPCLGAGGDFFNF